jgi:hypothetical protein
VQCCGSAAYPALVPTLTPIDQIDATLQWLLILTFIICESSLVSLRFIIEHELASANPHLHHLYKRDAQVKKGGIAGPEHNCKQCANRQHTPAAKTQQRSGGLLLAHALYDLQHIMMPGCSRTACCRLMLPH